MTATRDPSYTDLVYDLLMSAEQPLTFQEIFDQVNQRRPVITKNPRGTIRKVLTAGRQLVSLRELEDDYIQEVLLATGNNKTHAARILGIHPTSLLRRLKKEHSLN